MSKFMSDMRARFQNFMIGRHGMDDLAKAESVVTWVLLILSLLFSRVTYVGIILNALFWVVLIHMYFRVFSRNNGKRFAENDWYCRQRYKFVVWKNRFKSERSQKSNYRFFRCPQCKQRVRVPKGHGKIQITCPKCREQFTKRS